MTYACSLVFFLNDAATVTIYTLFLHDALPLCPKHRGKTASRAGAPRRAKAGTRRKSAYRSEEHTSELQSLTNLVCRLLLEKKNAPNADAPQLRDLLFRRLAHVCLPSPLLPSPS